MQADKRNKAFLLLTIAISVCIQVFIAQTCDVHRLLQGFAEPVVFDVVFEGFLRAGEFPKRFAVVVRQ